MLLAVLAAIVWIVWQGAWTAKAWDTPASYSVDALEYLARLRLAEERGASFLFDETAPRLGAPWTADWSAYPMPDRPANIMTGWLARVLGLIVASNLSLLIAHLLAVVAFYAAARALGHRPLAAGATGMVFGFCYYIAQRGLSHYSFALAYVVPLMTALMLVGCGARRLLGKKAWLVAGCIVALLVGIGSPYFGFVFGQLLGIAWLVRQIRHRGQWSSVPLAWLGVFLFVLAIANYSSVRALLAGEGAVMGRNYSATELYGLRLIEFVVPPPTHRWPWAADIGRHYESATSLRGELFFPYLGWVGMLGIAVLIADALKRMAGGRLGLRPGYLPLAAWIAVFATVGGIGAAFALGISDLFRATNRYSIFVLCLALLGLSSWITRKCGGWLTLKLAAVLIPLTGLALWDQLPPRSPDRSSLHERVELDRRMATSIAQALPGGASIFQLPAMPFLEQAPINGMTDYEHFRPYLHAPGLRFSYGQLAGMPGAIWQHNISLQPVSELVAILEQAGFSALYIHRAAYADRGAALDQGLAGMGRTKLFDEADHLIFRLNPQGPLKAPSPDDPRLHQRWDEGVVRRDDFAVLLGSGWHGLENDHGRLWRWARQNTVLLLHNPTTATRSVRVRADATTVHNTTFTVSAGGKVLHSGSMAAYQTRSVEFRLEIAPGQTALQFATVAPAKRAGPADPRMIAFSISNLTVDFTAPANP